MSIKFIENALCTFAIICAPLIAEAQNKTFTSGRVGRVNQFTCKTDTISFSDYVDTQAGKSERFVFINGDSYRFVKSESKGDEIEEIFDKSGNRIAVVPLTGVAKNSMLFVEGEELKFVSTGKTTWSYTKNGKDAVKVYYYLLNDQKHYVIQWDDTTATNSLVPALVLAYGSGGRHVYRNKKRKATVLAVVGLSTFLVVIGVLMDTDSGY